MFHTVPASDLKKKFMNAFDDVEQVWVKAFIVQPS